MFQNMLLNCQSKPRSTNDASPPSAESLVRSGRLRRSQESLVISCQSNLQGTNGAAAPMDAGIISSGLSNHGLSGRCHGVERSRPVEKAPRSAPSGSVWCTLNWNSPFHVAAHGYPAHVGG